MPRPKHEIDTLVAAGFSAGYIAKVVHGRDTHANRQRVYYHNWQRGQYLRDYRNGHGKTASRVLTFLHTITPDLKRRTRRRAG